MPVVPPNGSNGAMAAEVAFYQLSRSSLERALPRLLQKVLDQEIRAVVLATSEERLSALDTALWVDDPGSFLAHGRRGEPYPEDQPIYLTTVEENPNGAPVLVLIDGADARSLAGYARCLHVFDGNDAAATAADDNAIAPDKTALLREVRRRVIAQHQAIGGLGGDLERAVAAPGMEGTGE